jgi:hypothetical protein
MYKRKTKRDHAYLAVVLCAPMAAGLSIRGTTGWTVAMFILTLGLVVYELRMYRLTPRVEPKVTTKENLYMGFLVGCFVVLLVVANAGGGWATPWLALALCLAIRNYRMRRRWDEKIKPNESI